MALIACTECNSQVSDKAAACPKCGAPTAGKKDVVTTQQTSKVFKIFQIIGVLLILYGVVSCVGTQAGDRSGAIGAVLIGFIIFIGARIGAWWRNG